jgi:hypothetical protein
MTFSLIGMFIFTSPTLSEAITTRTLIYTVKQQGCASSLSAPAKLSKSALLPCGITNF